VVRIYITKWVVHRGILVADVKQPAPQRGSFHDYAHVSHINARFWAPLRMGVEAFTSLEEAQADAEKRFLRYQKQLKKESEYVERALLSMKNGKRPKVHTKFRRVADCKAFD
jgi:hypothetical protein